MRLALYGNVCNNFFAVARALRQYSQIDAHLFLDNDTHTQELPESEDSSLKAGYPDWIHRGDFYDFKTRIWPGRSALISEFSQFDAVMLSGHGVRLASFIDGPTIFFVTGGDLTVLPFPWTYRFRPHGLMQKIFSFYHAIWYRRGIFSMTEIWVQSFECYAQAVRRLKIPDEKIVPSYFPILVDTNIFSPGTSGVLKTEVPEFVGFDFIVFHPSRIMIDDRWALRVSGQWKRNDELVKGFADWVKKTNRKTAGLALVDRGEIGPRLRLKALIKELGIEKNIIWLVPPRADGFTRTELVRFYQASDIVADDFGSGAFGSIVVEGAACEKPVFCYLDESVMQKIYPWHPILSTPSRIEIREQLERLYLNPESRLELGRRSREWAVQFHSLEKVNALYVERCLQLFNRLGHKNDVAAAL